MELILQTDRQPMEWTNRFLVLSIIVIQFLSISYRSIEEYLMKTVDL